MTIPMDTGASAADLNAGIPSGDDHTHLRMALNLLTEDPRQPSGAHWCWTRIVPEMASRLLPGEELHLMLSASASRYFPDRGDTVRRVPFPWSNEHRVLRTASEHLLSPVLLPLHRVDLLSTAIAPLVNPTPLLVIHMAQPDDRTVLEIPSRGAPELRDARALPELPRDLRQCVPAGERVVALGQTLRAREASRG